MLIFTFIYEEDENTRNNKIEIDENLFKRIARDDMTALDELYGITERTMYAFSLSLTKDHQRALDLMQDTYVKILSAAHLYKPMGKPLAWMFTIARNLHYSNIRKEKRNISLEPEEISDSKRFSYVTDINDRIVLAQKLDNTSTIEKYAQEYGISVSKMTFIRNMIILNPELETKALVNLSIGELVRLSQGMGLKLDKIIDSEDLEKVEPLLPEQETEKTGEIISSDQARSIALSAVKGTITDFDFDEDDLEYEVEIEAGELEYEIIIDAKTGAILKVEVDD